MRAGRGSPLRMVWLPAALGLTLYLVHAARLGDWIVDDAGISFAYARNLAAGHGLVAQPGEVPVEGFTNLLWVLLLALPMGLRVFDPVLTPKILGGCFVGVAFVGIARLVTAGGRRPAWLATAGLAAAALTSGFVIWCASGLENALYVCMAVILAVVMAAPIASGSVTGASIVNEPVRTKRALLAGGILFLLFCTRPDGAFYFWIPPFLFGLGPDTSRRRRNLLAYVGAFVLPWFLLTLFRSAYFHDVFPNTFYAKKGEGAAIFAWMLARWPLPLVVATVLASGTLVIVAVACGFHALGRRLRRWSTPERSASTMLFLFFASATSIVLALPGDWMLEHRFATPMFLFGPAAGFVLLWDALERARFRSAIVAVAAVFAVGIAGMYSARHTPAFVVAPTLPLDAGRETSRRIARALKPLGPRVAVLTPDVGGALWEDHFRVIDLVGLTDRQLGRTVRRDRESIRVHILGVRRPEAVWVHTFWMGVTGFDADPDFAAAYAPVWEDRPAPGSAPIAGLYVRRDVGATGADGVVRPASRTAEAGR
ncbi:MAG TPA: hypothetical protein VFE28_01625 [Candidatus Krumholzibacteria bacterium]|nr:hypothetical protein [Candidatus Krumholzibacteria bacterium]